MRKERKRAMCLRRTKNPHPVYSYFYTHVLQVLIAVCLHFIQAVVKDAENSVLRSELAVQQHAILTVNHAARMCALPKDYGPNFPS